MDEDGKFYTERWCEKHYKECLTNFDLNMDYFSLLNHNEFRVEIENFLTQNSYFTEVDELNPYDKKAGYYIMILDKYKQLYVGTTKDIKIRIRQHWSAGKSFDRLLFPMGNVNSSILSIDSFRALDTTRIYVYETENTFSSEDKFINQFSPKFVCNRLGGGKISGGLLQAITMMKERKLN